MKSPKIVTETHRTNLSFLLKLKEATGILNNLIHDNLALMAIARFKTVYPRLTCTYINAGASGHDILGKDDSGSIILIAEVKTTLPDIKGSIKGGQLTAIKKDLKRLAHNREPAVQHRYLVLLSKSTEDAVQKQLRAATQYPSVTIINAFREELHEVMKGDDTDTHE